MLGFILRSTNVRNSFEYFYCMRDITRNFIGDEADIIISSEWDYSPLTYGVSVGALPNCVLLGLPASEAANVLVIPLAGHELGHAVWQHKKLSSGVSNRLQKCIVEEILADQAAFKHAFPQHKEIALSEDEIDENFFIVEIVKTIKHYAIRQCEEIFCDAFGVKLFGESFLKAFRYLLAPNLGGKRDFEYPALQTRAELLVKFGAFDEMEACLSEYESNFSEKTPQLNSEDNYIISIADKIAKANADWLCELVCGFVRECAYPTPDRDAAKKICECFKMGVPPNAPPTLATIINGAWLYVDEKFSKFSCREPLREEFDWISQVAFKSIEILEFNQRVGTKC